MLNKIIYFVLIVGLATASYGQNSQVIKPKEDTTEVPKLKYIDPNTPITLSDIEQEQRRIIEQAHLKSLGYTTEKAPVIKNTKTVDASAKIAQKMPVPKDSIELLGVYATPSKKAAELLLNGEVFTIAATDKLFSKHNTYDISIVDNTQIKISYWKDISVNAHNKKIKTKNNNAIKKETFVMVGQTKEL